MSLASEFYDLRCAKISLLSDKNIWYSAFTSKIVFGIVKNFVYVSGAFFSFEKSELSLVYLAIKDIVSAVAQSKTIKGLLLEKVENVLYNYDVSKNSESKYEVLFSICIHGRTTHTMILDLDHLNDFVNLLCKLIFPFVSFSSDVENLLNLASNCELDEIKKFSEMKNCINFVKTHKITNDYAVYLQYYLEIIIIVCKLKSLHNPEIVNSRIQKLF
ncbi:MAG: hypothetical protein FJ333_10570, partial [Sphingomonadales bacterium]|nr:hypothetical protein [Sphingomonadales bacterium]